MLAQGDVVIMWQFIWDAYRTKYCDRFLKSEVSGKQHSCLKHERANGDLPNQAWNINLPIKGFNIYTVMQHDKAWIETWFFHMHRKEETTLKSFVKNNILFMGCCVDFSTKTSNNIPINQKSNYEKPVSHAFVKKHFTQITSKAVRWNIFSHISYLSTIKSTDGQLVT